MTIDRRIISISSGKGGVGKSTFALNYALSLSQHGRTVLIDLDTGTSSIRNCLDAPVERDLYHFFKKGFTLADCVSPLGSKLDPEGRFKDFGFIASPKHLIEDITNFTAGRRDQLIEGINALPAKFIVLDLKAGLDANVVEFLPYSNSGILVFTPHLPAATLAAADIVKAILFRKLRILFAPGSPVYSGLKGITPTFVNSLIDRVEDPYDSPVHSLDGFIADLEHALGDHPVVRLVSNTVETFHVYYVLNRFNGVTSSYDSAVKPFVSSLADQVSSAMTILNLGWVVEHEKLNEANIKRTPILLMREEKPKAAAPAPQAPVFAELDRLATLHLGKPPRPAVPERAKAPAAAARPRSGPALPSKDAYLDLQLDTLRRMYDDMKTASYLENFRYVTARSLHLMGGRRPTDFGDTRLFKSSELQLALQARGR